MVTPPPPRAGLGAPCALGSDGVRAARHAAVGFPCGGQGGSAMDAGGHLGTGRVRGKDGTEGSGRKQGKERAWQGLQSFSAHIHVAEQSFLAVVPGCSGSEGEGNTSSVWAK